MKKYLHISFLISIIFLTFGYANGNKPTEKIIINNISLKFNESRHADNVTYYTSQEMENIFKQKVLDKLTQKELVGSDATLNKINIEGRYDRCFVGDETPFPSDSLRAPFLGYSIDIMDNNTTIKNIYRKNTMHNPGMVMNLKILAAKLRDKKDEDYFIDVLANTIVEEIEDYIK